MPSGPVLRFDEFELDIDAGELRKRGRRIKLAPQPFRLLAMLAGAEGRVIDREAIRKQLWKSTHVDFEHGVNFCVREIRRALLDHAERPKYIETLPRRGYRFIALVTSAGPTGSVNPSVDSRVGLADKLAEGRRLLREMGVGTLDQARKVFEEALSMDADCAMAHCGLGAASAMRFISRCEPRDIEIARMHLERAAALDPELAEPYPWLCYVYARCGELEKSLEFGRRGVRLLPDLVHAQYFLGTVCFASCELGTRRYAEALERLLEAARLDPRWAATWMVLSLLCLLNGEYAAAKKFARRLVQVDGGGGPVLRFPGAENLMGFIALREGDMETAHLWFSRSLEKLSFSDHTYAQGMRAWSTCGLGDVELRRGNPGAALAHYRLAWQIVQEHPAILGQERHGARALTGLAAAYAAGGEHDRALHLLSQAEQRLASCLDMKISTPATNLAELHHSFALANARVENLQRALEHLRNAFGSGWHDSDWLLRDREMVPLLHEPSFRSLIKEIGDVPRLVLPPEMEPDLANASS